MAEQENTEYGFGTYEAIDKMEEIVSSEKSDRDTILINIDTLMRNRNRNDVKADTLIKETFEDIQTITDRFVSTSSSYDHISSLAVVFYTAYYKRIVPKGFLRQPPPSRMAFDSALDIKNKRLKSETKTVQGIFVTVQLLRTEHKIYRELIRLCEKQNTSQKILMLSHMNCDYHIGLRYTDMILVDSFTGNTHSSDKFAVKVYGTIQIPFCPATHAVLGDKELIKPTYTRDEKRKLIQQSTDENWRYKSCDAVKSRMQKAGWLKPRTKYPLI